MESDGGTHFDRFDNDFCFRLNTHHFFLNASVYGSEKVSFKFCQFMDVKSNLKFNKNR